MIKIDSRRAWFRRHTHTHTHTHTERELAGHAGKRCRCSDLWEHGPGRAQHAASASSSAALAPEAPAAAAEGDAGAGAETGVDLLDSVLAKLTNLLSNRSSSPQFAHDTLLACVVCGMCGLWVVGGVV